MRYGDYTEQDLPFNPNRINISTRQFSLYYLIERLKKGSIRLDAISPWKRELWDPKKRSRLIESLLIRIPIPPFYFDCTDSDIWQVIDGMQRITTFYDFILDQSFALQDMEFLPQYNSKRFKDLPRELQRRIEETAITINLIEPGTPQETKFIIFERLNTKGLSLRAQELRHALNAGLPAEFIEHLADIPEFKVFTTVKFNSKGMADRELVNRFVAFYLFLDSYPGSMEAFLNRAMHELYHRKDDLDRIEEDFVKAMRYSYLILGADAFRRTRSVGAKSKAFNKALFDAISTNFAKANIRDLNKIVENKEMFRNKFEQLFLENDFNISISSATNSKRNVFYRLKRFEEFINSFIND